MQIAPATRRPRAWTVLALLLLAGGLALLVAPPAAAQTGAVTIPLPGPGDAAGTPITFDPTLTADTASLEEGILLDDCSPNAIDPAIYGTAQPDPATALCTLLTGGDPGQAFRIGDILDLDGNLTNLREQVRVSWSDRWLFDRPGADLVIADPGSVGVPEYLTVRVKPVGAPATAFVYRPADNVQDYDQAVGGPTGAVFHTAFDLVGDFGLPAGSAVEHVEIANLMPTDTAGPGGVGPLGGGVPPTPGPLDGGNGIQPGERDPDVQYVTAATPANLAAPNPLQIVPGGARLTTAGETRVLQAAAFGPTGQTLPVDAGGLVWTSSAPDQVSVADNGDGTATVTALVADGSARITVGATDGPARTSPSAIVSVAAVQPGTTLVPDSAVVWPPPNLPAEPATLTPSYPLPHVTTDPATGTRLIGSFPETEVLALVDDAQQQYPAVLLGAAPAVGQRVEPADGSAVVGTVQSVETRGQFSLVLLDWSSQFVAQDVEIPIPGSGGGFVEECKVTGSDEVFEARLEPKGEVRSTFDRSRGGFTYELALDFGADIRFAEKAGGSIGLTCSFTTITLEQEVFKDPYTGQVQASVKAEIQPADELALNLEIDATEVDSESVFEYRTGLIARFGVDVNRTDDAGGATPIFFEVTQNPDANSRFVTVEGDAAPARLAATATITPQAVGGLNFKIEALNEAAGQLKELFPGLDEDFEEFYDFGNVKLPLESRLEWANSLYVLELPDQQTPSKATASVAGNWTFESEKLQEIVNLLGLDNELPTLQVLDFGPAEATLYSPLRTEGITVDGITVSGPGSNAARSVVTVPGESLPLRIRTTLARGVDTIGTGGTDTVTDPAQIGLEPTDGDLWVFVAGTGYQLVDSATVTAADGSNELSGTLNVTQALCDQLATQNATGAPAGRLEVVVKNSLYGLPTPAVLGEIPLDCSGGDRVLFNVNGVVFPDLGGNNRAIVGNECVPPGAPEVAVGLGLSSSLKTLPDTTWDILSATLRLDGGEQIAAYSGVPGAPLSQLTLPGSPALRDLPAGQHTLTLDYTVRERNGTTERTESVTEPFTVAIKPCLSAHDIGIVLDTSGSIDAGEFELEQAFATRLVSGLPVSPESTTVGVAHFSDSAAVVTGLSGNPLAVNVAINGIQPFGGGTNIGAGIDAGQSIVTGAGDRPDKPNVLIVVTDGEGTVGGSAAAAKAAGSTIISVGIGDGVNVATLQQVASSPSLVFTPADFESLVYTLEALLPAPADPIP